MDITCIPMPGAAFTWWLSITMGINFCIEALEAVMVRYGTPEILNINHGSSFICEAFTEWLKEYGIAINMDGKGCWRDNVFIEQLWESIKDEEVCLHTCDSVGYAGNVLERSPCTTTTTGRSGRRAGSRQAEMTHGREGEGACACETGVRSAPERLRACERPVSASIR